MEVLINGNVLEEKYLPEAQREYTYKENKMNRILLAEGEYYVLGDNREVSYDSRSFGVVKEDELLFKQSTEFTRNFYVKSVMFAVILVCSIILYFVLDCALSNLFVRCIRKSKE